MIVCAGGRLLSCAPVHDAPRRDLAQPAPPDILEVIRQLRRVVLLVDDETGFRRSLATKLRRIYQAQVDDVDGSSGALASVDAGKRYDLILLDISLPGMNGIDLCHLLRARNVPGAIALMSARDDADYHRHAAYLGVSFLGKPLDETILRRLLLNCGGAAAT